MTRSPDMPPEKRRDGGAAAKTINDLDLVLQAVLTSTPRSKPWQRQLLNHLAEAERHVQILRMTISMQRPDDEVRDASRRIEAALRVAHQYVGVSRADLGCKTAARVAFEYAQRLSTQFGDPAVEVPGTRAVLAT